MATLEERVDLIRRTIAQNKELEVIARTELQRMLAFSRGSKIVSLTSLTIPDYRKTLKELPDGTRVKEKCPYVDNLLKLSRINGMVNWSYESAVNRQRIREGSEPVFEAQPRKWGTRLTNLPFVSHVNKAGEHKLYLEMKVERVLETKFITLMGEPIEKTEVDPWLNAPGENPTQGVEEEIIVRDYDMNNILSLSVGGKNYIVFNGE